MAHDARFGIFPIPRVGKVIIFCVMDATILPENDSML
jgi:hypothetical protein